MGRQYTSCARLALLFEIVLCATTAVFSADNTRAKDSAKDDARVGIGVQLMPVGTWPTIVQVRSNSPAVDAGLLPGDRICAITDNGVSITVNGASATDVESRLLGKENSQIEILVTSREQYPFAVPRRLSLFRRYVSSYDCAISDPYVPFKEFFATHAEDGVLYQVPEFGRLYDWRGSAVSPHVIYTREGIVLSVKVKSDVISARTLDVYACLRIPSGNVTLTISLCSNVNDGLADYGNPNILMTVPPCRINDVLTKGISQRIKDQFELAAHNYHWTPQIWQGNATNEFLSPPSEIIELDYPTEDRRGEGGTGGQEHSRGAEGRRSKIQSQ